MKTLVFGAGVIGTTYAWQLSCAGQDVTLWVRKGKKAQLEKGIAIRYIDERGKGSKASEALYCPPIVEDISASDSYDLIIVAVRSNQLDDVLPMLAEKAGKANVLFFQNNWHGDGTIKRYLSPSQYLFGFSRLVGGWKTDNVIECKISNAPGMSTMLGEVDGKITPRLQAIETMMKQANLKPELSQDILGWLATHYVEYLGAVGAILKAGSAKAFADNAGLVREAILATREGLAVCRARGIDIGKAAPINLRLYSLPLAVIVPLGQAQYRSPDIQRFFDENIAHGLGEIAAQYDDVMNEGKRLGVAMPNLSQFEKYYHR